MVNENLWKVKSQTSDQYYNVCKTAELSCYDHCYNKYLTITCMELCEHLYTCDCPDFNRICKHVYKIHSYTNTSSFQQYNSNSSLPVTISHSPETPLMNDNQLQETPPSGFNDHNKQILEFYKNLDELKMLLQNKNVQVMRLAHVNLVLRDLINQCKAVVDISTDKLNQETSKLSSEIDKKIHGNKKLQCQWRPGKFYRTKKLNSVKKSIHPYPDLAKQKKLRIN